MKYIYPKRIVASDGVENEEAFYLQKPLQIGLFEKDLITIKGGGHVILDFGCELSGGARVLTFSAGEDGSVRLRFGESVSEACAELGERGACNDHSLRDFRVELRDWSDMTFGQTGFRFLRIDALGTDAAIRLKTVVAASDADEREQFGSFECDDPLVNEIWNTAAYTLRLCLKNGYFWDGIKRDRLVWIGDLYPEMRAAHCLFGDVAETLNSIDFAMNETTLPRWMAGMPAYSLWWLIILRDEYAVNGDKERFVKYLPYIYGLLKQIDAHIAPDGKTAYPSDFIDWPSRWQEGDSAAKKAENKKGMYYLTKVAVEKTRELLVVLGGATEECDAILAWLSDDGEIEQYKQIAGIGVFAGDTSKSNGRTLLQGGSKGFSTFLSYFILTGMANYGAYAEALSAMKEYYGGMLSVGATTFWEDFDLEWLNGAGRIDELPKAGEKDIHGDYGAFCYKGFRHSFCHGWSAGVIPYLVETVAGISIAEDGMKKLKIKPRLSGLKRVKVDYPTAYGLVTVEHIQEADGVKTTVIAPTEIQYTVE